MTVEKVFAKEQEATKKLEVLEQSTSTGSSMRKSESVPATLKRLSMKSFLVIPTLAIL